MRAASNASTFLGLLLLSALLAALPAWAENRPDFSRLVVVGDSLSAGYQNGSLLDSQQPHGYANLVAMQARTKLALPLIAPPGIPPVLELKSLNPLVIEPAEGASTGRDDPTVQATDLAVPGHTVADALNLRPDLPIDSLTDLVLGLPGLFGGVSKSQVEWAETLHPTTVVLWLGNNDALNGVLAADPAYLTPEADFEAAYGEVIDRLAATGAKLVVANIPDVTEVPYLTSAETAAARAGATLEMIGPLLGIRPGDFVTPDAAPLIPPILEGTTPGPLPGNVVLTAAEAAAIRSAVDGYNAFIAKKVHEHHAAQVDIHALIDQVARRGYFVGGQRLTTAFLGGLFSLDGIHPTNTGYAVIANEFIGALDGRFAARVPLIDVERIAKQDPLVLATIGHPLPEKECVSVRTARALRSLMLHERH